MGKDSPPSTPTSEVSGKEKSSKEDKSTNEVRKSAGTSAPPKDGKKSLAPKDSTSGGSSTMTLNAAALGSVIAEALKSSFEGLRDSMNACFTGLGDLIASHADEEPDATMSMMTVIRKGLRTTMNHLSRASLRLRKADLMNRGKTEIPKFLS